MTYPNLDEMYADLGVVGRFKVVYHIGGECASDEVTVQGIRADSAHGDEMASPVAIMEGVLADRENFREGVVYVESVDKIELGIA